jgi:hypothetical protein
MLDCGDWPLTNGTSRLNLLMLPYAHAVPHDTIHDAYSMCPLRCVMRNPYQRLRRFRPVCRYNHTLIIVGYIFAWLLEQLYMYCGRQ